MIKALLILIVKLYKYILSPLLADSCRFSPSCSAYTLESVKKHGALYGLYLSIKRIAKCNPFYSQSGFDPVP